MSLLETNPVFQSLGGLKTYSDALRDLVPLHNSKIRKTLTEVLLFVKLQAENCKKKKTLLRGCFSRFLNCTNGTESRKASHLMSRVVITIFLLRSPSSGFLFRYPFSPRSFLRPNNHKPI